MKIGVLTTSFPRDAEDSAGRFVLESSRFFADQGHQVEVLFPEAPQEGRRPLPQGMRGQPIPYLRPRSLMRTFYRAGAPENLRRDPIAWLGALTFPPALWHRARKGDWDALISHWCIPAGWVGAQIRRGRPHLVIFHSGDLHLLRRLPMRRQLAATIARGATSFAFVSEPLRAAFLALLPAALAADVSARSVVTPMGFTPVPSLQTASPSEGAPQGGERRLKVLTLGRLVPIKGLDILMKASSGLAPLHLTLAGVGPEEGRLRKMAETLGVHANFPGHVSGVTKAALLRDADIFVMPSRRLETGREEGTPTALLEAMSVGLPVIATRTGGMPALLRDGHAGRLVPPDDPIALRDAILQLHRSPEERVQLGSRARARANDFTWEEVGRQLAEALSVPLRAEYAASPKGIDSQRSNPAPNG